MYMERESSEWTVTKWESDGYTFIEGIKWDVAAKDGKTLCMMGSTPVDFCNDPLVGIHGGV